MDYLSGIAEAIRKTSEAYVEALSAVGKALETIGKQAGGVDRDRLVENWLRVARMSKDGIVTALEQGFELWERECRRMLAASKAGSRKEAAANPMEVWAENWRKATEAFTAGGGEGMRKQAEMVQKNLQEGLRAWQRLWAPEKKS